MSSTNPILITGATGNTGSALLQLLEERGVPVRAMVRHERDVARLGNTSASIVIGDFDDADSLAGALKGIHSAYLVTPSSAKAEAQQIQFAELAAVAGVKHLVKLSQFAANDASPFASFATTHSWNEEFVSLESAIPSCGQTFTFKVSWHSNQRFPSWANSSHRSAMRASALSMFVTSP